MKTYRFSGRIAFAFFFSSLLFFSHCNKDDNSDDKYRLTDYKFYMNGALGGTGKIEYLGEKVSMKGVYNHPSTIDSSKTFIEYPTEDSMVMLTQVKTGDEWEPEYKQELTVSDGFVTQCINSAFYAGTWSPQSKYSMQYTDGLLTEELFYYNGAGVWKPTGKISYEYSGALLVKTLWYVYDESWQLSEKEEARYNGNHVKDVIHSLYADGAFSQNFKYEFRYEGNLVTRIDLFDFYTSWDTSGYYSYIYDSFGNVVNYDMVSKYNHYKYDYIYEKGKGNYRQLKVPAGGLMSFAIMPYPTKSSTAFLKTGNNDLLLLQPYSVFQD